MQEKATNHQKLCERYAHLACRFYRHAILAKARKVKRVFKTELCQHQHQRERYNRKGQQTTIKTSSNTGIKLSKEMIKSLLLLLQQHHRSHYKFSFAKTTALSNPVSTKSPTVFNAFPAPPTKSFSSITFPTESNADRSALSSSLFKALSMSC